MKNLISTQLKADDLLLTASIWLANIDMTGLMDYALKAIIGGVIWFGFKIASDRYASRIKNKKSEDQ